ncbi:uncharacterized protein LOC141549040 [Sminthopsis crassicaudata]|uniref:uncharacterized protein LOC141549040 n=1 Tax=Sminthopsis crassicaudata TaxID=9301 RepID=UPI003D68D681
MAPRPDRPRLAGSRRGTRGRSGSGGRSRDGERRPGSRTPPPAPELPAARPAAVTLGPARLHPGPVQVRSAAPPPRLPGPARTRPQHPRGRPAGRLRPAAPATGGGDLRLRAGAPPSAPRAASAPGGWAPPGPFPAPFPLPSSLSGRSELCPAAAFVPGGVRRRPSASLSLAGRLTLSRGHLPPPISSPSRQGAVQGEPGPRDPSCPGKDWLLSPPPRRPGWDLCPAGKEGGRSRIWEESEMLSLIGPGADRFFQPNARGENEGQSTPARRSYWHELPAKECNGTGLSSPQRQGWLLPCPLFCSWCLRLELKLLPGLARWPLPWLCRQRVCDVPLGRVRKWKTKGLYFSEVSLLCSPLVLF